MTTRSTPAASPTPKRRRRRIQLSATRWVQVGFSAIAVISVLVGVGWILPAVPNDGPDYELPKTFTATTQDGREITFTAERGVKYGLLRQNTKQGYRADILDVKTPNPSSTLIPIDPEYAPKAPGNSITMSFTRIAQRPSSKGPNPTVTDKFGDVSNTYSASESVFPGLTDREIGDIPEGSVTLTSELNTIQSIEYGYGVDGNLGDEPTLWFVTFNYDALQKAGKTNLIYPLEWYANPLFPELRRIAPWVAGYAVLAALLTPLAFGIGRRIRRRRDDDGTGTGEKSWQPAWPPTES